MRLVKLMHNRSGAAWWQLTSALGNQRGWPNAFSALPIAKDVFGKRPK
jgi:hypothetical protein